MDKVITLSFRQRHIFLNLITLTFLIALSPALSFADADRIFKENQRAVVVVVSYDGKGNPVGQGSGFVVRRDGVIVTNYHVISNAEDIKVKAGDRVLGVDGLIHLDKENDLVILKVKGENLPTVRLGDIEKIGIGEKVYVISSPMGLENTISDGVLSGIREITPGRKLLQITAPISPGSSGGPVFNKNGEVIGIVTFIIEEAQNINFAMPVNLIKDRIDTRKVTTLKDSGIEAYKEAIRIKPDYAEAHNNLGGTFGNLGMYREAVEAYKEAIRIKPDFAEAHFSLGVAYEKLGMYREAIGACKEAIRIKPDLAEAHYNLGVTYRKLGMYREAIGAYKEAIRIKPDYAEAHFSLGVLYLLLGYRSSALDQYRILKDLDPQLANKLFNLIYK